MILLVDDDESVLNIYSQLLEHEGFKVSAHLCAKQGLTAFSQQPQAFKAIITDYNMPNMNGLELISAIHDKRPDIKTILYSGMLPKYIPNSIITFSKPTRIGQLLIALAT